MFCTKCGALLLPREGVMKCTKCDYSQEEVVLKEKKKTAKKVEVMEKGSLETRPRIKAECKDCGNNEAYTWTLQTRSADEPETIFFKCTSCGTTWRSYS